MELEYLHWDSDFYKKRIFKLLVDHPLTNDDISLINLTSADLFYIQTSNTSEYVNSSLKKLGAVLIDKKVTYTKIVSSSLLKSNKEIYFVSQSSLTPALESMTYQSGVYSRFNLDPHLNYKFEELYRLWIMNSLNRTMADEVFVAMQDNTEVGFVTLSKEGTIGKINLIAVDGNFRGKKIASSLLTLADEWYLKNTISKAVVITQLDNRPACCLYENSGYKMERVDYIYHLWT